MDFIVKCSVFHTQADAVHLTMIERLAEIRMDKMLPQMMEAAGVTEQLKACDRLAWVGLVNNCKARGEEIIFAELICC